MPLLHKPAVEGRLDLDAELIRLVVQALRHQDHVNNVPRARRAEIGLSLHYLTNYELESHQQILSYAIKDTPGDTG
ncbi:MAG: hypothetical protein ACYSR6_09065 [Planctomycetota bacterium]|jgi:hypothetical protein